MLLLNPIAKSRSVETALIEAFSFIALARSVCGGVCGSLCSVCGVCAVCGVFCVAWRDRLTYGGVWYVCDVCVISVWSAECSVCVV